jgi:hypothetical protein
LSGIRLGREQHGRKVKVTAPPIKKNEVWNSWGFSDSENEIKKIKKHNSDKKSKKSGIFDHPSDEVVQKQL